jgi:hypothetical protein
LDQALPLVRSFEARLYFLVGRVSRAPMSWWGRCHLADLMGLGTGKSLGT